MTEKNTNKSFIWFFSPFVWKITSYFYTRLQVQLTYSMEKVKAFTELSEFGGELPEETKLIQRLNREVFITFKRAEQFTVDHTL